MENHAELSPQDLTDSQKKVMKRLLVVREAHRELGLDDSFPQLPGVGLVLGFELQEHGGMLDDELSIRYDVAHLPDHLTKQEQKLFGYSALNKSPRFARDYVGSLLVVAARRGVVTMSEERATELAKKV